MKYIRFFVNGEQLNGAVYYPKLLKPKNPAILFIHGWTSEQKRNAQFAEVLSNLGFISMIFDLRGHGVSEGSLEQLSREDFMKDILTAYDFLVSDKEVDMENVSVVASSFGAYLGMILTTKRKVKNLALRVPANYPDDGFDKPQMQFAKQPDIVKWREQKLTSSKTISLRSLNSFTGNVLIIESEKDVLVPHQTIENYKDTVSDKRKLTYIVMNDATHSIKDQFMRDAYEKILVNWLTLKACL